MKPDGYPPGVFITMRLFLIVVAWFLLFAVAWPLALLVLVLFPLIWLLALPFRLAGMVVGATFSLLRALLYLPARLLGSGPHPEGRAP